MLKRLLPLLLCVATCISVQGQKNIPNNEWNDKGVYETNKTAPRTNIIPYSNEDDIELCHYDKSSYYISLNGEWHYDLKTNYHDRSADIAQKGFSFESWGTTTLPDRQWIKNGKAVQAPQLTNVLSIPSSGNTNVTYARHFDVPKDWKDYEIFLQFRAQTAYYVWINNQYVGYGENSQALAEFCISEHLKYGKTNDIVIQVLSASDGSLLEMDADKSRNGITGDIALVLKSAANIQDFSIIASLGSGKTGDLQIDVDIANRDRKGRYYMEVEIWDPQGHEVEKMGKWVFFDKRSEVSATVDRSIPDIKPWTAETPSLYTAVIRLLDEEMTLQESVGTRFGFRSIDVTDGELKINGKPITLHGVVFADDGRHSAEQLEEVLLKMKRNNINALRTAGNTPATPRLYELCDKIGLYVVCDANISPFSNHNKVIATDADYSDLFAARATDMYESLKNHVSIIAWSLGESDDNGVCMTNTYKKLKSIEKIRPILFAGAGYSENSDIIAVKNATPDYLQQYLSKQQSRPLIMLSYAGASGNSYGSIEPLWQTVRNSHGIIGGFASNWNSYPIFDQRQQRIVVHEGICDKPYLDELKEVYRPYSITLTSISQDAGEFSITNHNDFLSTADQRISYVIFTNLKQRIIEGDVTMQLLPGETKSFKLKFPKLMLYAGEELFIRFTVKNRPNSKHTDTKSVFSTITIPIPSKTQEKQPLPDYERRPLAIQPVYGDTLNPNVATSVVVRNDNVKAVFDMANGQLDSLYFDSLSLFASAPQLNFWRIPTDNDLVDKNAASWIQSRPTDLHREVVSANFRQTNESTAAIDLALRYNNSHNETVFDIQQTYTILYTGDIIVHNEIITSNTIKHLPRVGMQFYLDKQLDTIDWFGTNRETYRDRKTNANIGCYSSHYSALYNRYGRPQENGNHTNTRWCSARNNHTGIYFDILDTVFNFSVSPFADNRLLTKDSYDNISEDNYLTFNIDLFQAAIGCAQAGITTQSSDAISRHRYSFDIHIRPYNCYDNSPRDFESTIYPTSGNSTLEMPVITSDLERFDSPMTISIAMPNAEGKTPAQRKQQAAHPVIHYTLDGTTPTEKSPVYTKPFTIENSTIVNARAFMDDKSPSFVASRRFNYDYVTKAEFEHKPNTPYNYKYETALYDGETGDIEDFSRNWIGFSASDFDVTFTLSKTIDLENVRVRFAHHPESWIFAPKEIAVYVSSDGEKFSPATLANIGYNPTSAEMNIPQLQTIDIEVNQPDVRFVRIVAQSIGRIPQWHKAKGLHAWLMIDEVEFTEKIN